MKRDDLKTIFEKTVSGIQSVLSISNPNEELKLIQSKKFLENIKIISNSFELDFL
jgi:uncharacterized protein (UPF0254 family)